MKLSEAAKIMNGELMGQDAHFFGGASDTRKLKPGNSSLRGRAISLMPMTTLKAQSLMVRYVLWLSVLSLLHKSRKLSLKIVRKRLRELLRSGVNYGTGQ